MKGNLIRYINFFNNIVLEKTNWELTKLVTQKQTNCSHTMFLNNEFFSIFTFD